ncbi:hypothetical protein EDB81DRAFT_350839 [Dactylonectria macrodidyma]|uniref:Ecp2 effector protein-like domain-containing protein n=1 Tax=Dactylonectria macrodidyma TaxID=307937 RepID=A0A9P9FH90_9HYPO|nr:hypothetical protein EDB81DRAFT_350839 [Dactylonectria macrodidyma]
MRFIANPVALAALLARFVSAAPAELTTAAASEAATTTVTPAEPGLVIVSTVLTCGSVVTATALAAADEVPAWWTPTAHHQKACDAASFDEASTDNPVNAADWNDCASLYSEWSSYNGTFTTGHRNTAEEDDTSYDYPATKRDTTEVDYIPVMQSGSCTFALKPDSLDHLLVMGDVDVSDILKEALNGYSSGMMLGVRGSANCAVRGGGQGVKAALGWQLYYPGA